ncbi:aminotransferase class I/II-fold pyridoxal phosphate-dependent enzyme [Acidobacteria bacterium AB60]|nr:aminotransferase class I/II-fold pyridoxal phosphate-dependent enzyme [Acidobacteria bacterium AB60]
MPSSRDLSVSTIAIHGGRTLDSHASSILFPLYQTSTFVHDAVGVDKGFSYSRVSNPTVDALEKAIGALEGTPPAVCFRTGMGAVTTLFLSVLRAGDHAVLSDVVYGGTMRIFHEVLYGIGISGSFVDTSDPAQVEAAITPATRIIFIETPGNPTLKLADIEAVSQIAKRHSILLAVDNTFLTPILQKPFELGADISVLSTTKYIDGHNATVGGSLATHDEKLLERFRLIRKTIGSIQSPFEAWLVLQGIKTLPARLKLHCEHAAEIAGWLEKHSAVDHVYYPGLDSFPQKGLAEKQQSAPGAMIAFELKAGTEAAIRVLNSVQLCSRAESLGGLETLITHPSSTTHADVDPELRRKLGISDGLIRLSVGLEDAADIIADLEQAFAATNCSE